MKVAWMMVAALALAAVMFAAGPVRGADEAIDMKKAQKLHRREVKGESLTREEQAYLERAKAERQKRGGATQEGGSGQGLAISNQESTGLVPLTEMTDAYKGEEGGLYGGGKNEAPARHLKQAMAAAASIQRLDKEGKPSERGKIVLMSIGMSNTTNEFSVFQQMAMKDPEKNPGLTIVDGAQGGMDAAMWTDAENREEVWQEAEKRLTHLRVTPEQVQVVWIKQALAGPAKYGEYPKSAKALRDQLVTIINLAKEHYPNLRMAYLSSRIYGGFATTRLNPEPYAYEGAFAVRDVIAMQMKRNPAVNADENMGDVNAPIVMWGPYLWADGVKGRKVDGLKWLREDFLPQDGTHPSSKGRQKVADLLMAFFKTDATAKGWFLKP